MVSVGEFNLSAETSLEYMVSQGLTAGKFAGKLAGQHDSKRDRNFWRILSNKDKKRREKV